jgi:hypothetical protein
VYDDQCGTVVPSQPYHVDNIGCCKWNRTTDPIMTKFGFFVLSQLGSSRPPQPARFDTLPLRTELARMPWRTQPRLRLGSFAE